MSEITSWGSCIHLAQACAPTASAKAAQHASMQHVLHWWDSVSMWCTSVNAIDMQAQDRQGASRRGCLAVCWAQWSRLRGCDESQWLLWQSCFASWSGAVVAMSKLCYHAATRWNLHVWYYGSQSGPFEPYIYNNHHRTDSLSVSRITHRPLSLIKDSAARLYWTYIHVSLIIIFMNRGIMHYLCIVLHSNQSCSGVRFGQIWQIEFASDNAEASKPMRQNVAQTCLQKVCTAS